MDSKKEIYDLIPQQYYPRTLFFEKEMPFIYIRERLELDDYIFPLVGKPDIGMRGLGVQKLNTWNEVEEYAANSKVNFLIQEFVSYEQEAGIFYYRIPGRRRGVISGIVQKEFLTVTGNGKSTIKELLQKDKRYILQLAELEKVYGEQIETILSADESLVLVPYGNHARGAKFIDASHQIDDQLTNMIDKLCRQIRGFYYGRMDIRFNSWEDLRQGKNLCIIELNGAGSEPTHIYDPSHSVFFAWKEIIRHWRILYKISKANRKRTRKAFMSFSLGVKMFKENFQYLKLLKEEKRA